MTMNPPKTVTLVLDKTTAGTYVYKEEAAKPRAEQTFPTIYVQKHAVPAEPPPKIRVTIDWD